MPDGAHGIRRTYQLGCRCLPCRASNATYCRARRTPTAPKDPKPVEAKGYTSGRSMSVEIHRLRCEGFTCRQIAARAGVSVSTIYNHRASTRVQHSVAAKVDKFWLSQEIRTDLRLDTPRDQIARAILYRLGREE